MLQPVHLKYSIKTVASTRVNILGFGHQFPYKLFNKG